MSKKYFIDVFWCTYNNNIKKNEEKNKCINIKRKSWIVRIYTKSSQIYSILIVQHTEKWQTFLLSQKAIQLTFLLLSSYILSAFDNAPWYGYIESHFHANRSLLLCKFFFPNIHCKYFHLNIMVDTYCYVWRIVARAPGMLISKSFYVFPDVLVKIYIYMYIYTEEIMWIPQRGWK